MDLAKAAAYPLRLKVRYDGDAGHYTNFGTLDFTVTLVDPCIAATLTVNAAILTSTSIAYSVYTTADSQTLSTSNVSSTETTATCPAIELDILNDNGTAFDSSVFTFTSGTGIFAIETSDTGKVGTYNLKVTAKYTGASYTSIAELLFNVIVDDPCSTSTLTIDPTIIPSLSLNYQIGYAQDVQTFIQSKVSPTLADCPAFLFTLTTQAGSAPDATIFTYSASSLTTLSTDLTQASTYPLRLTVRYTGDPAHYTITD